MIYKANIREIFGSRSGGKGAYIYTMVRNPFGIAYITGFAKFRWVGGSAPPTVTSQSRTPLYAICGQYVELENVIEKNRGSFREMEKRIVFQVLFVNFAALISQTKPQPKMANAIFGLPTRHPKLIIFHTIFC